MDYDLTSIQLKEFCKIDKKLTNFKKYSISLVIPIVSLNTVLSYHDLVISLIKKEIEKYIYNLIYDDLKLDNLKFLDARNLPDDVYMNQIEYHLLNQHYKNAIVNPKIGSYISSSMNMNMISQSISFNSTLYKIGRFQQANSKLGSGIWSDVSLPFTEAVKIKIDQYIMQGGTGKFTDIWEDIYIGDKIIFFDDINYNIEFYETETPPKIVLGSPFVQPNISFRFKFATNIENCSTLCIVANENSKMYLEYLSKMRDEKISEIIN